MGRCSFWFERASTYLASPVSTRGGYTPQLAWALAQALLLLSMLEAQPNSHIFHLKKKIKGAELRQMFRRVQIFYFSVSSSNLSWLSLSQWLNLCFSFICFSLSQFAPLPLSTLSLHFHSFSSSLPPCLFHVFSLLFVLFWCWMLMLVIC